MPWTGKATAAPSCTPSTGISARRPSPPASPPKYGYGKLERQSDGELNSPDLIEANIARRVALFPLRVTEAADGEGGLKRAIDFGLPRQEHASSERTVYPQTVTDPDPPDVGGLPRDRSEAVACFTPGGGVRTLRFQPWIPDALIFRAEVCRFRPSGVPARSARRPARGRGRPGAGRP
jgi:hypothetical protein